MNPELSRVTALISSLPGIGQKSAMRIAFHLLRQPRENIEAFAEALTSFHQNVEYCPECSAIKSADSPCSYCNNPERNREVICIIEQPADVYSIESTGEFSGLYHVLMGVLSPLDGIGPDDLRIKELKIRLNSGIQEVIIATNPSIEGNATANFIASMISEELNLTALKVTRIATGLALGSQLDFTDSQVISQSIRGRVTMNVYK